MKKIFKKIHSYYIISIILIIVFIFIIPWIILQMQSRNHRILQCRNICPRGEVEKIDNGICYCSDGRVINPDDWDKEVENEE